MSTFEVCLVRHGQSVSNAEGVWQGQGDSPLSDLGRTQVDALGAALLGQRYDLVLSSDLSRAAETARAAGVEVEHDRAWREIDVGNWEGLTMEQVVERFPEQIAALKDRRTFAIGGGETSDRLHARRHHRRPPLRPSRGARPLPLAARPDAKHRTQHHSILRRPGRASGPQ